ncbi:MAG: hypothetical protein Q9198_009783, partial [Flavoplaca austrocitrina]
MAQNLNSPGQIQETTSTSAIASTTTFKVDNPVIFTAEGKTQSVESIAQTRRADGGLEPIIVSGYGEYKSYLPAGKGLLPVDPERTPPPVEPQSPVATQTTPNPGPGSNTTSTSRQTTTPAPGSNPTSGVDSTVGRASSDSRQNSNDIRPGVAAGIGIGCAIAGALIAAAIFILFFRRRRRRAPARSDAIPLNGFASVEKTIASPDSIGPAGMIERNLPQPVEDQALGGEMSRLKTAIKNHVQSYYHTNSVKGSVDQVALGVIAMGNMPLIASTLGSLLSNPVTRMTAIRFCITWTVISRIDQNCDPNLSFLPPEVATCLLSISSTRDDPS